MRRILKPTLFLACLLLSISPLNAATVSWQSSTSSALWVDKGTLSTTTWDNDNTNYISVDEDSTYQEIDGYGGCFNEIGWKVLMKLSQSTRDSVIKLLFDSVSGCNFNICRVPIGANDYSLQLYSLDETSGDTAMNNFSIAHDTMYLIPYIKAAMAVKPSLKVWGSPWSVPTWMKDSKEFNSGSINANAQTFTALALYFAKAVNAYQKAGLHYYAIMPTNEPNWKVSSGYPVTGWSGAQLRDFIKTYLGPRFKTDDVNAQIYMGTIHNDIDVNNKPMTDTVFSDSTAYSHCTGGGYQYQINAQIRTKYPDKRFVETETSCGTVSGFNNSTDFWNYAMGNDDLMRTFFTAGVSVYSQWNMILDTSGRNKAWNVQDTSHWRQYAMIMIDTVAKKITLTPQFYQVRHYSFVKPGAYRIATSGNSTIKVMAFRNLDGENILIATNEGSSSATVAINFNGQKIKPTIPASSFNTFRIAGTAITPTSPYSKIEAEKFAIQSGILIRSCSDGGSCVTLVQNNDWTSYHNIDFGNGAQTFEARVSGIAGGSIEVHLDSCNGPAAGTCTVAASSAWNTVSCPVTGVSGKHTLYLKYKGTATGNLFDLNWWMFDVATGIGTARENSVERVNKFKVISDAGKTQTLQLDFSQPVLQGNLNVSLFDLTGRLVTTLYKGRLSSPHLSLPLYSKAIRSGTYIISVFLNNTPIVAGKNLIINN